jgi:4-aminobutyrate aminotransferase-like enzyme/Ser/Thr protein kinase RdoA (MazF antagonist)
VSLSSQRPTLDASEAARIAEEHYGISGDLDTLPSERDQNFLLTTPRGERWLLKIAGAAEDPEHLQLQNAMLAWLAERGESLPIQRLHPTLTGEVMPVVQEPSGKAHRVRLLSFLPGGVLAEARPHSPALLRDLGRRLGELDRTLAAFAHPAAHRPDFMWNPTRAPDVIRRHLDAIDDPLRRLLVEGVLEQWTSVVAPLLPSLRCGVIYNDANDHNVLVSEPPTAPQRVTGFIDLGDVVESCVVCDPAIAVAYAMLGKPNPLTAAAHVVAGYHEAYPLTEDEIEALFPLACARLATSVSLAASRQRDEPDNEYLFVSEAPAWETLERLAAVHPRFARNVLRQHCGLPPCPESPLVVRWLEEQPDFHPVVEPDPARVATTALDLSVAGLDLDDAAVVGTPAFVRFVSDALETHDAQIGIGRYDEPRPVYTTEAFEGPASEHPERRTVHLGADLFIDPGAPVFAPLDGRVHSVGSNEAPLDYGPTVILQHDPPGAPRFYTLYGHLAEDALHLAPGMEIARGDAFARVGTFEVNGHWPPHLHFQLVTDVLDREGDFPGVAPPSERGVWLSLSPDPNLILRLAGGVRAEATMSTTQLMASRDRRLGRNLSLAYSTPLQIVRGRGQFLFDEAGRAYLDCVNNVCHVGHCHPRVVAAARRQMAVLNTNTRYLHEHLVRYAERLCELLPPSLSVCYFVCSGSEANELALRMAREHAGGDDLVVLEGGYHGNTGALVDTSSYKFDGPGGRGAPRHVHKAVMPDDYRGPYRRGDPDCGEKYAAHVREALDQGTAAGRRFAAFLSETLLGCGGQIELPAGYLAAAYGHARHAGAVCIADEVQVGFGRLGTHFWGFETQEVVPDIVTLGKPIGNGHPLGAVVTTPEIAASFDTGMEYFNTFGGNPVSCAVGLAVLDVVRDEALQERALQVGSRLRQGLQHLVASHPVIGDVRGRGLFLGVELTANPTERTPAPAQARYVVERMKDHGILLSTDGPDDNVIKIKPPLVFSVEDADRLVDTLDAVLGEDSVRLTL